MKLGYGFVVVYGYKDRFGFKGFRVKLGFICDGNMVYNEGF